jgi:hypothetical protein
MLGSGLDPLLLLWTEEIIVTVKLARLPKRADGGFRAEATVSELRLEFSVRDFSFSLRMMVDWHESC